MPCRLQPYICISDDTLAAAYRRFANTCLVNHNHTNTRRHGSNVPGPLEARRRLARRRMAGLSMAGPSPGLIPDFGALFGSGGVDMTSLWAPPGTAQSRAPSPSHQFPPASPTPRALPTLIESCTSRTVPPLPPKPLPQYRERSLDEYMVLLAPCRTLDSLARAHTAIHFDSDVSSNFSKAAFRSLLNQSNPDQILAFLQSDLNQDDACNFHAYLNHLIATNAHPELIRDYFNLVCDKIVLSTMPTKELSDILDSMADKVSRIDSRLLLEVHVMLHQSLVQAYAPNHPPIPIGTKLLENMLPLPPSVDVSKLLVALVSLSKREGRQVMIKHLKQAITHRTEKLGPSDELMPILSIIPPEFFDLIVFSATRKFVNGLCRHKNVLVDRNERLVCWLEDLRLFRPSILQPDSSCAALLYPFLASNFTIAELGRHLRALHPADAAMIVLHNWMKPTILEVPKLSESDILDIASDTTPVAAVQCLPLQQPPTVQSRRGSQVEGPFQTYGVSYTVSRSPTQSDTHRETLSTRQEVFDTIALTLRESCKPDLKGTYPSRGGAWIQLFKLLSNNKIDYTGWLSDLFQVLKDQKSPVWTYHFFAKLSRDGVHIPYPVAVKVMRHFIDLKQTQWALDIFNRSQSTQSLSSIPELVFALIDSRIAGKTEAIFDLLNRPDYANSLPVNLRSKPQNSLSRERIQLVHQVAYAIAKSPLLSSRTAFRQVCDCLNYLRDRGAPLSSLMSRALVHAGVTRTLRDGTWLSTERFQWILQFVRRLEGDEVADSLDEAAFTFRSENFELNGAHIQPLNNMEREADLIAWEYRKQLGRAPNQQRATASPFQHAGRKKAGSKARK
jgi:hypothetical protein